MKLQIWVVVLGSTLMGLLGQSTTHAQAPLAQIEQRATQGDPAAQYNLGVMYGSGQGVPQDHVEAHTWFSLVARVPSDEQTHYAEVRDALAQQLTTARLAEAQQRAADWRTAFEARQAD